MMELDDLQLPRLYPFHSSLNCAVRHKWPVLHMHLIDELEIGPEPFSKLSSPEQVAHEQERLLPQTMKVKATELIQSSELVDCTGNQDSRKRFVSNSDVMLDALERVGPMEIPNSSPRLLLQESTETSALQMTADLLEMTIHPDFPTRLRIEDEQTVIDSLPKLTDKAAGMEAMGSGEVLHSEQSQKLSNLQPATNRNESPDLGKPESIGEISEMCSVMVAVKPQTSSDWTPEGRVYGESSAFMPMSRLCRAYKTDEGKSLMCLEDTHFPFLCSSHALTKTNSEHLDSAEGSVKDEEMFVCKESEFPSTNEVNESHFLSTRLDTSTAVDGPHSLKENVLQHSVPRERCLSIVPAHQEMKIASSDKKQEKHHSDTHISIRHFVQNVEDINSSDSLETDSVSCIKPLLETESKATENSEEALSWKPNLPPCPEHLLGAKSLDTQKCSLSFCANECNVPLNRDSDDCHKSLICPNKLEDSLDKCPLTDFSLTAPLIRICSEPPRRETTSNFFSINCKEISTVGCVNSDSIGQEQDSTMGEQSVMMAVPSLEIEDIYKNAGIADETSKSFRTTSLETYDSVAQNNKNETRTFVTCSSTQTQGPPDMTPAVEDYIITPPKIGDPQSLSREKDSNKISKMKKYDSCTDNPNDPNKQDQSVVSSLIQPNASVALKEINLKSGYLKVPCQTVHSYPLEVVPQRALVPYVNIFSFLAKTEVPAIMSSDLENMSISKVESQEPMFDTETLTSKMKESIMDEARTDLETESVQVSDDNPKEIEYLYTGCDGKDRLFECSAKCEQHKQVIHTSSQLDKIMGPLIECAEAKCNDLPGPFPNCSANSHSKEVSDVETSGVVSILNQSKCICSFNLGTLSDSFVPLEVSNPFLLSSTAVVRSVNDSKYSKQTTECSLQKEEDMAHTSSSSHSAQSTALSVYASSSSLPVSAVVQTENTNREEKVSKNFTAMLKYVVDHSYSSVPVLDEKSKQFPLIESKVFSSRPDISNEKPESSNTMESSSPPNTSSTKSMQAIVPNDIQPVFTLLMEDSMKFEKKSTPVKAPGVIRRKRILVKTQKNVYTSEMKMHDRSLSIHDHQYLGVVTNESPIQSACYMKVVTGGTGSIEKSKTRPAPQSLTCSQSQMAKRPKICNENCVQPASSNLLSDLNCFSHNTQNYFPPPPRQSCKRRPPSTLRNSSQVTMGIPVKKQPSRQCKSLSVQGSMITSKKTVKNFDHFEAHTSPTISLDYRPLPSKHLVSNLTTKPHYPKVTERSMVTRFKKPMVLQKYTQDQMLLHQLSTIANKLMAPSRNSCKLKPSPSNLKVAPLGVVQLQARKLLNVFSCVNMKISSQSGQMWSENVCLKSSRDHLLSQSMDLYPASLPKVCFSNASDPLCPYDTSTFPVSFHLNVDPSYLADLIKFNPPDYMFKSPLPTTQSSQLSEWTLSLFLSSHMPAAFENVHLLTQWNPHFRSLKSSSSDSSCRSKSARTSGCSMLGLHTVLALSSPGCYRLWTRKRNLGSRIPTIQKLSVTQFAHGLIGLPAQFSQKKEVFSSLPFSMGRILSTWSRHGSSALSAVCTTPHPHCNLWLPSQSFDTRRRPGSLLSVPQMPVDTVPPWLSYTAAVQNLTSPSFVPTICHHVELGLPFCPPSLQDCDRRLSSCFDTHQEDVLGPSFATSTRQEDNLCQPFGLSARQDDGLELPCVLSPRAQACPFQQREALSSPCGRIHNSSQGNEASIKLHRSVTLTEKGILIPGCLQVDEKCYKLWPVRMSFTTVLKEDLERKPQRVSQIRIRKTVPKPDPYLTPMGLPKTKRLNKKEFSLEDIYTNKNYKSPPPVRSLETIFEEPQEKNGILISVSQQKKKRILEFQDCTAPRKKRAKGRVKVMTSCKRGRKAAMQGLQLDALLSQKLMDLENYLLEEESQDRGSAADEILS
ncbi:protein PRR14L [Pseudophryne corroboree]|uniref:protein PRR14L n=1 Tax=Pseudophryne corroboree TaxID=495146 RepID=UPI0030813576